MYKLLKLITLLIFFSCAQEKKTSRDVSAPSTKQEQQTKMQGPYRLNKPTHTLVLENKLMEISSLAFDEPENALLANDDESGKFFYISPDEGYIREEVRFTSPGDYEGIERVADNIYVVKSNGNIYEYNIETKKTSRHKNELRATQDVEGLCYYEKENALLLACKGQPLKKEKKKKEKCVYSYDLMTKSLNTKPFLTIKDKTLTEWVENNYDSVSKKDLDKKIKRAQGFSPSGIALSNDQKKLYILSAKGSLLLVFSITDNLRELETVYFLDKKRIPQPEGICFDDRDMLYISSEGQGLKAKLFKFKYYGSKN